LKWDGGIKKAEGQIRERANESESTVENALMRNVEMKK